MLSLAITWDRRDLVGTILSDYETPPKSMVLAGLQQARCGRDMTRYGQM